MKIMIFGFGSIGRRHAKILRDNFKHELFAYRSEKESRPNDLNIKEVYSWEEVKNIKPDIAFITNPTFMHIRTAVKCANLGMSLFIEKPLSHNMEDIDTLEEICRQKNLVAYTAYCLRFHPVINKLKELIADKNIYHARIICSSYLPLWRKDTDSKESYSGQKDSGGGVLLDLSHEFDYIQYLFGEITDMKGGFGRVSEVTVDSEDYADIAVSLNRLPVNLHLDFLSRREERTIKVDFLHGYIFADLLSNKIEYSYNGKDEVFTFSLQRDDYLKEQSRYFFDNIKNPGLMNNLDESRKLLTKILLFKSENG